MNYYLRLSFFLLCFSIATIVFAQSTSNSILKSGKWYKIKVKETNIYKLTYEDLKSIGFEAPENIRIYGNGGAQLSYLNSENNLNDLEEVPIYQNSGSDNDFGPGDYYLFYGEGPNLWQFDSKTSTFFQKLHEYALCNYYFITASFGEGKRIQQANYSSETPNITVNSYSWRDFHESELYNLGNSGRLWLGERFNDTDFNENFVISDLIQDSLVKISTSIAVRSGSNKNVVFYVNDKIIDTLSFSKVNLESDEAKLYSLINRRYSLSLTSDNVTVKTNLKSADISDRAYINYVTVNAKCALHISSNTLFFRNTESVSAFNIARFKISGATSNTQVWNITNQNNVFSLKSTLNGDVLDFIAPDSVLQEYVAFNLTAEYTRPILNDDNLKDLGWIENQNLHGMTPPELLIVTHPLFIEQANQIAELHRGKDNMTVEVVTTQQVYNEFSSGKPDLSAIRNFARLLYNNSSGNSRLKYLLLFGDGSYDNRTINDINPNYIPTYQSEESIEPTVTYTCDDFYGQLDDDEWDDNGTLEIGVGRIPVSWDKENEAKTAQGLVDKIVSYYNAESMKDWRNQIIFLGDDGEFEHQPTFMEDSDELSKIIASKAPMFNINKIYLDAYQQISSSTGASYPEVEKELQRTLNKGALLFNYMGHGGENGITQEKVFQRTDIENLRNGPYFPLFITATCQVGRFDNVIIESVNNYSRKVSFGESALLNPYGGGIALFTTTRLVYQDSNKYLSEDIFNLIFDKDSSDKRYRIGDIFRIAKNKRNMSNSRKFALLGDPALTLAFGEYKVITDSVNHLSISETIDTAQALGNMVISGYVSFDDSTIISDFNGVVQISVFDKKYSITTNGNDGIPTFDFELQDKLLFHGKASVVNGRFEFEFKLPKDITYSYGNGKISYYAQNGVIDAKGCYENFYIGGTYPLAYPDFEGPNIKLFMNDSNFVDGGITSSDPVLLAYISDENGINTTGNGIGHDLTAVLLNDNYNYNENYTLNDYFEGDLDTYKSGIAYYQLSQLETGNHTIRVKAWDIYNNSSEETLGFFVDNVNDLIINKLFCFPNPMQNYTCFQYSHNLPGNHQVTVKIYDLSGRLIYTINRSNNEQGFVSEPLYWERKSASGTLVSPGVYPYTITVKASTDYSSSIFESTQSGRLIIIP
jgi:hypothetical protein